MSKKNKKKTSVLGGEAQNSFLYSLNRAEQKDVCSNYEDLHQALEEEKKKGKVSQAIRIFLICVIAAAVVYIGFTLVNYRRARNFYSDMLTSFEDEAGALSQMSSQLLSLPDFGSANSSKGTSKSSYSALFQKMKSRLNSLSSVNPDIYGWIIIPGTENINYPVLQTTDNEYYLDHEYTHGYLPAGSIFADYRCDRDTNANFNTVIYGHNMQNGMMFSELIKFMDEDFWQENQYVYLYTPTGIYTYRIFSVYKTDYRYKYVETGFPTAEEFVSFAKEMQANSKFGREGIELNENTRILTLSTCTNGLWSDRYCVQAVLVDYYNEG